MVFLTEGLFTHFTFCVVEFSCAPKAPLIEYDECATSALVAAFQCRLIPITRIVGVGFL
ncbi:hypothetical protein D3C85_1770220 [compost metagenome]